MSVPLQISQPDLPSWTLIASQAINFAVAIVGIIITYIAYRGYRRNDSRPMLFIAIGFFLAIVLQFVLLIPMILLTDSVTITIVYRFIRDIGTLAGLLCILYAIRMPT